MARYQRWAPYVPVAERRRKAERAMAKRRKAGHDVSPVRVIGRAIASTFWGRAWCDTLEGYRDYDSRLPRGRTYVRNGSVVDLHITPGRVAAVVSGSALYDVTISVAAATAAQWRAICADCAGGIDSLVELLQGRFSRAVMERLCRQPGGLFPRPAEIRFTCTCPDHALMCKHVAAVLYGIGARLDEQPALLFRLRAVDETELLRHADTALPAAKPRPVAGRMLEAEDVAALFGLDMAAPAAGAAAGAPEEPRRGRRAAPPAKAPPATAKTGTPRAAVRTALAQPAVPKPALPAAKADPPRQKTAKREAVRAARQTAGTAPGRRRTTAG